jgi:hypothetical protein
MRHPICAVLTSTAAVAALTLAVVPSASAQTSYDNCTALHHDFKHGVAKGPKAAAKQVRDGYGRPAYGPHARDVYWANHTNLDRDKDGTACEA